MEPHTARPEPLARESARASAASWPACLGRFAPPVLPPSTIAPGSAISSTPVSARPRVIQSAARFARGSSVLSPVRFAKGTTSTRFAFSGAGSRARRLTAAATTARPNAAAATPSQRRRGWGTPAASGGSAAVWSGASSVAFEESVATRSRTAPASARVSGAGSASSSAARRFAKPSYASSAPARSPSRSSDCISRRSVGSSSGAIRNARRPHCADSARPPRSASKVALRSAMTFSRTRSSSSHCSNSGEPRMKNPSSRSPR